MMNGTKMLGLFACAAWAACAAARADHVVNVRPGDDLERVRDGIRAARADGRVKPGTAVTVLFAPGDYPVTKTLVLDARDGGTEAAPVTWRAERPGTVRFLGGHAVPASAFGPVQDPKRKACFAEGVRERIREADVAALLPGALKPWPDAFRGMPPAPWLYQDGEPLEIARWPDADWSSFTNVVDNGLTDDPTNEHAVRPGVFYLRGAPNASRWNLDEGVWADGYWVHDWDEEVLRLAAYDAARETASPRSIHTWGLFGRGTCGLAARRFKVVNVAAELDAPGEWWLDRATKKLYLLPVPGKEGRPVVLATDAPTFFKFTQAAWMTLENLDFAYSHGTARAVQIEGGASHVTVRSCSFENFAGDVVGLGGRDCTLERCRLAKIGGTPVVVSGGDRRNLVPAGNLVTACDIGRFGRFRRVACGVSVEGCGNAVRNCEIHHGPAQAIRYGGNEHLFADNDLHHVVLESCDAGAVYTGRDAASLGNLLFGNFTHELGDDPKLWSHRHGFYFDDCDWGDDVIGNRFHHTGCAVFIGGGNLHRVHNNLVADALSGFHFDARGVSWERRLRGSFLVDVEGHSWAERGLLPFRYREAPWSVAYAGAADVVDDRPNLPHANAVSGNVFVNCTRPYGADAASRALMDEMPVTGNAVLTSGAASFDRAPQPVTFAEAARAAVKSPGGRVAVEVFLDVAGRLSWTARVAGRPVVGRSTLGVTVGTRDYGKLVVPGRATCRVVKEAPVAEEARDDADFPVAVAAASYAEATIPLRDLVDGRTAAFFEVRVFDAGVAFRYRVPGAGVRRVRGEMTAWSMAGGALAYQCRRAKGLHARHVEPGPWNPKDGVKTVVCDAARGAFPRFRLQGRGGRTTGLVFPSAPRGWNVTGEVLTPWRVTLFEDAP